MYKTVIWATDGSAGADAALKEAVRLAESSGGRVVAVHCDQRLTGRAAEWPALPDESEIQAKVHHEVRELQDLGVDIDLVIRTSHREPADVIAKVASEFDADLVVCGTRGRGALASAVLGSFTQRLLHVAPCPVLAVPEHAGAQTGEVKARTESLA